MADSAVQVAVIGGAECDARDRKLAQEAGAGIARAGAILLCGGGGGVMAAAAAGARSEGGRTVGILPGASAAQTPPNPHIEVAIFTGLGQARNQILVLSADAVIGIGGGWGTLSEIALARKQDVPVILLDSWQLSRPDGWEDAGLLRATTPRQAVDLALTAATRSTP